MSELRLVLPECKYCNDADELLKDQFIFGIYNKEIQDHLFGEIKEMDNSVKSQYEARKIESKLAQKKVTQNCHSHSHFSRSNQKKWQRKFSYSFSYSLLRLQILWTFL